MVALTPLDLSTQACLGREALPVSILERDRVRLRVVSACLGRPQRIGGWDSLARRPLPLRSVLPSGSTLFCEVDNPAGPNAGAFASITAAGWLERRMKTSNDKNLKWKEKSSARKPEKDKAYQRTLQVKRWLKGE